METALNGSCSRRSHRGTPRVVAGCHRDCGGLFSAAGSVVLPGQHTRVLSELNVASRCQTYSPIVAASAPRSREGSRHYESRCDTAAVSPHRHVGPLNSWCVHTHE